MLTVTCEQCSEICTVFFVATFCTVSTADVCFILLKK